jgi:hypothetical protein
MALLVSHDGVDIETSGVKPLLVKSAPVEAVVLRAAIFYMMIVI